MISSLYSPVFESLELFNGQLLLLCTSCLKPKPFGQKRYIAVFFIIVRMSNIHVLCVFVFAL